MALAGIILLAWKVPYLEALGMNQCRICCCRFGWQSELGTSAREDFKHNIMLSCLEKELIFLHYGSNKCSQLKN